MTAITRIKEELRAEGVSGRLVALRELWDRCENPVMGREFRSRMRGSRSYIITAVYVMVVMTLVLAVYHILSTTEGGQPTSVIASRVGRGIWMWGCLVQAVLVPLIVPAFTCGGITLERERDLLELLFLTRQSPVQICLGKLASGTGLGLMLVLSSVPVLSLSLMLGGISPWEIFACTAVLATSVVAVGSFGLAVSSLCKKTATASAITYLGIGFAVIGLPLISVMLGGGQAMDGDFGLLTAVLASMVAAFAPAVAIAGAIYGMRQARRPGPAPRVWWITTVGLSWCALLLFLHVPGVTAALLESRVLLMLHPVAAIMGVMELLPGSGTQGYFWMVCSLAYAGAAVWFFLITVARVKTLRSG